MKAKLQIAALVAMAILGLNIQAASAVVYGDSTITGKSPIDTGCSQDATTKRSVYLKDKWGANVGFLELRYSTTCHAAWARLTNYYTYVPGLYHAGDARVVRDTDGLTFECSTPAGTFQSCYTKMVYDLDPRTAHAEAEIDPYPDYYQIGWIAVATTSY